MIYLISKFTLQIGEKFNDSECQLSFKTPSDNIKLYEKLENCFSTMKSFLQTIVNEKIDFQKTFHVYLALIRVKLWFQVLCQFEEEVVQLAQHFMVAAGNQRFTNTQLKTLVYLCESQQLLNYMGLDQFKKIVDCYKDLSYSFLRENEYFKGTISGLKDRLMSNDSSKIADCILILGITQADTSIELCHFFIEELDYLHQSKVFQKCTSLEEKFQHLEEHLRSKLLDVPKMKELYKEAQKETNLEEFLAKIMLQDTNNMDQQQLKMTECKCGYKFKPEIHIVSSEEVDPAFCKFSSSNI